VGLDALGLVAGENHPLLVDELDALDCDWSNQQGIRGGKRRGEMEWGKEG
jgi:hypothetical protein